MEEDFRARLLADAGVKAQVGTAIDWIERPKAGALPALTLTLVSRVPTFTYDAQDDLLPSRVQIDVWGLTVKAVVTIARLLPPLLFPPVLQGGTRFGPSYLEVEQDGGTEEIAQNVIVFRRILDFNVWHRPA